MAGEQVLAHGVVKVEVNDREARARLNEIRREYHSTMQAIDHEEATAKIDADISPLDDKVAQARRRLKKLQGQRATATLAADKKNLDRAIKGARTSLKRLDGERATVEINVKGEREVLAAQERVRKATEKRTAAIAKAQRDEDRLAEKIYKSNLRRVNDEARVRESLNKQRLRELTNSEKAAYQMERERNEVPKLEAAYARLLDKVDKLGKARRKARGDDQAVHMIDLDTKSALHDANRLRNEIQRRIGRDPIHLNIMPTFGERAGSSLRTHFMAKGSIAGMLAGAGVELGQNMGRSMERGFRRVAERGIINSIKDVGRAGARAASGQTLGIFTKIGHAIAGLQNMTVRLGPFTTTIRGLIVAMTILGPLIVDVVGALGSLVSSVGAATLGVGALSAGFIGGAIPALLGFGLVIKGVVSDMQNVQKAQKAYDDAVRKGNTDLAAKKLKELRATMGNVSEATAKTWGQWKNLKKEWATTTAPARGSVFTAIAQGITTAQKLMPRFGAETNNVMAVAERATTRWQKALRSDEGSKILFTMMRNFRRTLGPVLDGLGNMVAYLGRVGAIASRQLPHLGREFRDWSAGVNSVDTKSLKGKVNSVIDSAKNLGRWFLAAGRLLKTFFAGGVEEGDNFVQTMTNAMNRWTRFLSSTKGQSDLHTFFDRAIKGTQALYSVLAPLISSFVMWAQAMAPLSRNFFAFAGAVAKVVTGFLSLTALRGPLSALATTLGVIWGVGKIGKAIDMIANFTRALLGMKTAEQAVAAATTEATVAQEAQIAVSKESSMMRGAGILGGLGKGGTGKAAGSLRGLLMGGLKGAGLIGIGVAAVDGIMTGISSASKRDGAVGKMRAIGQDLGHSFTFGLAKSAAENSADAFKAARAGILRSGKTNAGPDATTRVLKVREQLMGHPEDLTKDQKRQLDSLKRIRDVMSNFVRSHQLPPFRIRVNADPRDFKTLDTNFNRFENNLASGLKSVNGLVDQNLRAISQTMGLNSKDGRVSVEKNMKLAAHAINVNMKNGRVNATDGMAAIRRTFVVNSRASKGTTEANFKAASAAIKQAVHDGVISSKRGMEEIRKLWVSALKEYGFTPKQASNIASTKTGSITGGGGNEGGVNIKGGVHKATGGWIGQPGQVGRDKVPAWLGVGEAVLNRHHQGPVNAALHNTYGIGLKDLFDRVKKPHSAAPGKGAPRFAKGGIVALGHSLQKQGYQVSENPAFGGVHPVHAPGSYHYKGQALDINADGRGQAYENQRLDTLAARLKKAGWHILWRVADHFDHLHVDTANGGGVIGALKNIHIKAVKATKGLGSMSVLSQRVLDTVHGAAQSNLDNVASSLITDVGGNGNGVGAAPGQVKAWAATALRHEHSLTPANLSALVSRIMQESNGNPRAQNNWDVNAKRGDPSKGLAQVIGSTFASYRDKKLPNDPFNPIANLVAAIRYMKARYHRIVGASGSGYARGGMVPSLVGEGGGPEWIVDMLKGTANKVSKPSVAALGPQHAVIPTEAKHRGRAGKILGQVAASMGMPAFAGGKAPDPSKVFGKPGKQPTTTNRPVYGKGRNKLNLTDFGKARAGKQARREIKKYTLPNEAGLPEVDHVMALQKKREFQGELLTRAEGSLQEPDTFLTKVGEDYLGNDIVQVDQDKVAKYKDQLAYVQMLWKQMIEIIRNQMIAIQRARAAIQHAMTTARRNIEAIRIMERESAAVIGGKHVSVSERQAARVKLEEYKAAEKKQQGIFDGAKNSREKMVGMDEDLYWARQDADTAYFGYNEKISAVDTMANQQFQDAQPDLPDPVNMNDLALAKAESEGDIPGQIAAYQGKISEAQAMLTDQNPYNDIEAYNQITSAKSAIAGLQESGAGSGGSLADQTVALGSARADLYKNFGSNFALAGTMGMLNTSGAGAFGLNPAAMSPQVGATPNSGGINITNNYAAPPPDPHTWSQGISWELQAAV